MNWDAIGAIGEVAGALGVILTLAYLAGQLKQNTKATKLAAIQSSMENSARFSELLAQDDDAMRVLFKGLSDPEALDVHEKRKFVTVLNVFMRREAAAFYLHKEGVVPDLLWESRNAGLKGVLNQPGLELYLTVAGGNLPRDFLAHVETTVAEGSTLSEDARNLMFEAGG